MMWYICRYLFYICFEVDFFALLENQLLGFSPFRAKYPILLANKPVIVSLLIGAGRAVPYEREDLKPQQSIVSVEPLGSTGCTECTECTGCTECTECIGCTE